MAKKKASVPAMDGLPVGAAPVEPPCAPAMDPATDPAMDTAAVAALIEAGRLDVAAGLALAALDRRADAGDSEAAAAAAVLRAHQSALAGLPPLHGAPRRLPRANERGTAAVTELLALLRLQDRQLDEMHAALAELT